MRALMQHVRELVGLLRKKISRETLLELVFSVPWTPANIITAVILAFGGILILLRFTLGIGGISNLDNNNPWGIWIAFDLLCGVALAAGGYTTSAACYLFGLKRYHSAVRPAITTAFLGYLFVVFALHFDVGQPWRLVYPIFLSQGTTSVLFEVGLCVFIYLMVLFIEWTPAAFEWFRWKAVRKVIVKMTLPLTILGVVLSTMHQSSLGALFLTSPGKLHPLWYSSFLPVFFFVSSMFAGLSMVIFEGMLTHKWMHHKMDEAHIKGAEETALGFSRGAAFIMAGYLCIRLYDLAMSNNWAYLATGYGALYIVELAGFVAVPMFLYAMASRERRIGMARLASVITVAGIVVNRFIICLIAFNWQLPSDERYFPSFLEIMVSVFIVTMIITAYRLIATYMPVLYEHPDYREDH